MTSMKTNMRSALLCLLSTLSTLPSLAAVDLKFVRTDFSQSFSAAIGNASVSQKEGVFNQLLGAQASGLSWPDFPRTWIQKDMQKFVETTTSYVGSLNLPTASPISGGISHKYNIAYRYNTRISFVAVTKMLAQSNLTEVARIGEGPLAGEALEAIRYFDPKTNKNYFRTSATNPMVGFCVYEMSLNITKSQDNTISFTTPLGGLSDSNASGEIQSESQAVYSKFFQIDSKTSEMDYLNENCVKNFQPLVRPYVENDFNKVLLEYYTYNHPKNQCVIGGAATADGDENCLAWFRQTQDNLTQAMTLPRCEQAADGISRCTLRARQGMNCSLYISKDGSYTDQFTGLYRDATLNTYAHSCDSGLKCKMDRKPLRLGGMVAWPGAATCH